MPTTPWPEDSWERRTPTMTLDLAAVSRMIAPVFAPREAVSAQLLSGGRANTNYRVRVGGMRESFVLRLYTRDPLACAKEVALYNRVSRNVPLPAVFYADVAGELMGTPYTLRAWAEGTPLAELLAADAAEQLTSAAASAGHILAAIGDYSFPEAGFFAPDLSVAEPLPIGPQWFLGVLEDWLFAELAGARLGEELRARLWRFVSAHAPLLAAIAGAHALVHGDYKASNLLIRTDGESWEVAAVLDWEFAFAATPLFDLANLLRHERADSTFTQAVARGYTDAGASLPPYWRRIARLLDLLNLVQFLDQPGEREHLTRGVTHLIVATMDDWAT